MIEKKFEMLEKYKEQLVQRDTHTPTPPPSITDSQSHSLDSTSTSTPPVDVSFSEQQLEDVFKMTSSFSVAYAVNEDTIMFNEDEAVIEKYFEPDSDQGEQIEATEFVTIHLILTLNLSDSFSICPSIND